MTQASDGQMESCKTPQFFSKELIIPVALKISKSKCDFLCKENLNKFLISEIFIIFAL